MFCENVLFVYCIFLLVGNLDKCANTLYSAKYSVDHDVEFPQQELGFLISVY